ncbi:MAG: hypothetical protein AAFV07_10930, partial [Bacteroidota bacterium]
MELRLRPQLPVSGNRHLIALLILDPDSDRKALQAIGLSFPPDVLEGLQGKSRLIPFAGMLFWVSQPGKTDAEAVRRQIHKAWKVAEENGMEEMTLWQRHPSAKAGDWVRQCAEVLELSRYRFTPYLKEKPEPVLQKVWLFAADNKPHNRALLEGQSIGKATCIARDLVNEPANTLTAVEMGNRISELGQIHGFGVEVWEKAKIASLKMGGILAVNQGSFTPPTFSIMTHCPKGLEKTRPIVLVGKGIVYDTGGLSLKPTPNSMDFMKSDMAGAAAVIGTMCALAR